MSWPLRATGIKWRWETSRSKTCSRFVASVLNSALPILAMIARAGMVPSSFWIFSRLARSIVMVSLAKRETFSEAAWIA